MFDYELYPLSDKYIDLLFNLQKKIDTGLIDARKYIDMDVTEFVESDEEFSQRWDEAEIDDFTDNVISMDEMMVLTAKLFSDEL